MARYRFLKVGRFRGKLNDSKSFLHIKTVGEIHDIDEVFAARAEEFGYAEPVGDDVEIESEGESVHVDVESEQTSSDGAHEETVSAGPEESTDQKTETARQKRSRERQEAKAAKKAESALE